MTISAFPAPLIGLRLAINICGPATEIVGERELVISIRAGDAEPVSRVAVQFLASGESQDSQDVVSFSLVVPFDGAVLPQEGTYDFDVELDALAADYLRVVGVEEDS